MNHIKKYLAIVLSILLLTGCSAKLSSMSTISGAPEIRVAFVTDISDLNDHGFNQYAYAGVQEFASQHGAACQAFQAEDSSPEALKAAIQQAADQDYDMIVLAGAIFAQPCLEAAQEHPDNLFLALASTPADMCAAHIPSNVAMVIHKEEQAGFLAGYAAVADGYRELGFLGGKPVDAVIRYGYGYVQGAEKAAQALDVENVHIKYYYSNTFQPSEDIEKRMDAWYQEGTEVVFSCGGAIYQSVLQAADRHDGKLIGVDVDQSDLSPRFIVSATKSLTNTILVALNGAVDNNMNWPATYAGVCQSLGVTEECVGLAMENARFRNFDVEMYDVLYKAIVNDSITVNNSCNPNVHPPVSHITVDWQS